MQVRVASPKDFYAGLIFVTIGVAGVVGASGYDVGTATRMGPGYFPAAVAILLIVLGGASVVRGIVLTAVDRIERRSLEPMILILLGAYSFALLIDRTGLAIAVTVLLLLACGRRVLSRPIEVVAIIAALVTFSVGVFIYGFGMPMKAY